MQESKNHNVIPMSKRDRVRAEQTHLIIEHLQSNERIPGEVGSVEFVELDLYRCAPDLPFDAA